MVYIKNIFVLGKYLAVFSSIIYLDELLPTQIPFTIKARNGSIAC